MSTFASTIPQLEQGIANGQNHCKIKQQVYSTFANGLIDDIVFTARRLGLKADVQSGRGWINKPSLITFEGDTKTMLQLYKILAQFG